MSMPAEDGITNWAPHPSGIYIGSMDTNSNSLLCTKSTLTTELSPSYTVF